MKLKGKQIKKFREQKGLTKKELAEKTNLNTRNIQRLENEDAQPRAYTVKSIAEVLDMSSEEFQTNKHTKNIWNKIIQVIGVIIVNLVIVSMFGYLVMDSEANINSFVGALLLSLTTPFVIFNFTKNLAKAERLLKYSVGLWLYVLFTIVLHGPFSVFSEPSHISCCYF